MNKRQEDYCIARIDNILARKKKQITAKYTVEGKRLSAKEKLDILYQVSPVWGNGITLKSRENVVTCYNYKDYVHGLFDFSKIETETTTDTEAINREMAPLRKEAQRLKDEIMLGDSVEAMNLLRGWEESLA